MKIYMRALAFFSLVAIGHSYAETILTVNNQSGKQLVLDKAVYKFPALFSVSVGGVSQKLDDIIVKDGESVKIDIDDRFFDWHELGFILKSFVPLHFIDGDNGTALITLFPRYTSSWIGNLGMQLAGDDNTIEFQQATVVIGPDRRVTLVHAEKKSQPTEIDLFAASDEDFDSSENELAPSDDEQWL